MATIAFKATEEVTVPTWENLTAYEVTSDGDVSECGGWT